MNRLTVYRQRPADFYITDTLQIAAALNITPGPHLIDLQVEKTKVFFVFDHAPRCRQEARRYWSDELKVSAHQFARSLALMRDEIRSVLDGQEPICRASYDHTAIDQEVADAA